MMRTTDGHVMSHAIRMRGLNKADLNGGRYGLVKARVDEVIYPDDERNSTFNSSQKRVEYICTVIGGSNDGQKLVGVIDGKGGSQFNNEMQIRTPNTNTQSYDSANQPDDPPAKGNGEIVLIDHLFGKGDAPIITGNYGSPLDEDFAKKDNGVAYRRSFNGITVTINKNGEFNLSFGGGPKDNNGKPASQDAAGASVSIDKNGNLTLQDGEGQTFKLDRANKTLTIGKGNNAITLNTSSGALDLAGDGPANLKAKGPATVQSDSIATLKGSLTFIQNGGLPAARMGDTAIGTGNHGAPVVSTIINGSGECLIGG